MHPLTPPGQSHMDPRGCPRGPTNDLCAFAMPHHPKHYALVGILFALVCCCAIPRVHAARVFPNAGASCAHHLHALWRLAPQLVRALHLPFLRSGKDHWGREALAANVPLNAPQHRALTMPMLCSLPMQQLI